MEHKATPYFRRFALSMTCTLLIFIGLSGVISTMHAQTRAYVSNSNDNTVSVIDTTTNTVVATIPVGFNPAVIAILSSAAPKTKDECRNGGYKKFTPPVGPFKNQGQCIQFVNKSP